MPIDNKRLPVPDDSTDPSLYSSNPEKQLASADFKERPDGRKATSRRPIYVGIGINSEARGSAYMELDKTKVICAVHGPREVMKREEFSLKGQIQCEFKYAPFSRRLRQPHLPSTEEKELSRVIQLALEPAVMLDKFPKARFDVFVLVLEDDGGALSAAITCSSLALVNAGIPMYDIVIGASLLSADDVILWDPVTAEESLIWKSCGHNSALVTIGYMPSLNQLAAFDHVGKSDLASLHKSISIATDIAKDIHPILEGQLKNNVRKVLEETNENCSS